MITKYYLDDYKEAKDFLKDAKIIRQFKNSNIHTSTTYQKPNGEIWYESESHLESPYNTYRLKLIKRRKYDKGY